MLRDWMEVSKNLDLAVSFAQRFLDYTPQERIAALNAPDSDLFQASRPWHLAAALCHAKELVDLLEEAERAWIEAIAAQTTKH